MNYILQRIDTDTAWFVIALLVVLLMIVLVWGIGLKLTVRANRREHERAESNRIDDYITKMYRDVDTPAYQREARHPDDSKPYKSYDTRKL